MVLPQKQLVFRANWSYFFKACFLPVEFADVTKRFGIDFGESVVRHVENLEDILDRVKKGHFDVGNIVTGQIQSHDIGGRWVRGCSVIGQNIQIIVA